ncbi:MAG: cell envelope integrity protein TolA [Nitrospirae bacterium]|nr:cell envelope integrity protein TolA [Nitrospirota bacterium]
MIKNPDLQDALTYSLFIHILFLVSAIFFSRSAVVKKTIPYTVSLIDASTLRASSPASGGVKAVVQPSKTAVSEPVKKKETAPPVNIPKEEIKAKETKALPQEKPKPPETAKREQALISERIAAIQAKKRVENIVALRKIIEVSKQSVPVGNPAERQSQTSAGGTAQTPGQGHGQDAQDKGEKGDEYLAKVIQAITEQWAHPATVKNDLETVVSIKIAVDGKVIIGKVEKGSGDALFDRSVLRAINKASPLPKPPQEMEIGVRFKP